MKSKRLLAIICILAISNMYLLHNKNKNEQQIHTQQKTIEKEQTRNKTLTKEIDNKNIRIKNIENTNSEKDRKIKNLENSVSNLKNKNEQLKKARLSRGGDLSGGRQIKSIKVYVTYYTNIDNDLEGGQLDKKGKNLTSHNMKVCAMPKDITYGSILNIEGMGNYKVVDSGGAIQWLNEDKTECKVDVFIPNVTGEWLINNKENKIANATLYIK
ncbi:TPA: hypothetical protein ACXDAY_002198 [Clostridium botulinum]|uniref:hypothetical protein n=4 Tax=Clostridium botulinum TaxID=1491 RepID=UPI0004677D07|nr:hypothetical protein [Clostridium botulinum]APR02514.1 septum formation initiator family protein [Clostridium botulinum]AUN01521.1 hypothetical protein RSJ19_00630 [Clostridium botulinum]MBN3352099.1 hypothetical protein [Clostridium botulinum]MBN3359237.1 hypothetical protein [Clostridium botulinum]MBN3367060.1 hypothetical protein [Clostridium botulinum]